MIWFAFNIMKIVTICGEKWVKCASVSRKGKYFYNSPDNKFTILENGGNPQWRFEYYGDSQLFCSSSFDSLENAIKAAIEYRGTL